ncbi:DUF167 domain-containing protein [Microbulbifer sp. S227A]|uniref:DUF167 domain-containing protein n=1 Tax=Microbulbifer sp. S227A TaxID=3415131 RepID=UPI003C7E2F16
MARAKSRDLPDLTDLAQPGRQITVRVSPRAANNRLMREGAELRAAVTAPPENGKANAAVRALLASAMGVAPSDLALLRGQSARVKVFAYSASGTSRS